MKGSKHKTTPLAPQVPVPSLLTPLTLDSEGGVTIRSTTLRTVEFFNQHASDHDVCMIAVQILDTVVECMHGCMSAEVSRRETSAVLDYLHGMERRHKLMFDGAAMEALESASNVVEQVCQQVSVTGEGVMAHAAVLGDKTLGRVADVGERVIAKVNDTATCLSAVKASVEAIGGKVQEQMMTLISTVDNAVRASVEKLNVTTIAAMVSETVRKWLQAEVDGLKAGQKDAAVAAKELEGRVREVVVHMVTEPQSTRHEHLIGMLNALPVQVAQMCTHATSENDKDARERLSEKMAELRVRLDEALATQSREVLGTKLAVAAVTERVQQVIVDVARLLAEAKDCGTEHRAAAAQQMGQVPCLLKAVLTENFKVLESQAHTVKTLVYSTQQQLVKMERDMCDTLGSLQVLRKGADDVTARVDAISHQITVSQVKAANNTREKGRLGEARLIDLLAEKLTARDNYSIDAVNGIAHACDINIRRLGFPDVRLESKAHGELTGEKVRVKETVKFQSDLLAMNSHGIFVSLFSDIAGKGKIEFQVLANNKLAVYLSNINYDTDIITDVLQLIYRVDAITVAAEGGADSDVGVIKITPEAMMRVQLYLKDFAVKVHTTKTHLKESISLLNEITFDLIERVLLVPVAAVQTLPKKGLACDVCNFSCVRAGALANHKKFKHPS